MRLRWSGDAAGLRFRVQPYKAQSRLSFPTLHTPQPGPALSLRDPTRPHFVLIKLCHCNSCTAIRAGVGLSGEAHEIPPTSAPSRFSLPAQQTWQKHFDFYSSGLRKTKILIWEQVSKDFCRGCKHGSHGHASPKAPIPEGILRLEAFRGLSRAGGIKPGWLADRNDKTRLGDLILRQQEQLMGRPAVKIAFLYTRHENGPKMLL